MKICCSVMAFTHWKVPQTIFFSAEVFSKAKLIQRVLNSNGTGIIHWSGHLAPWSILRHGTRSPDPTTRSPRPRPPPSPSSTPPSPPHPPSWALLDPGIHGRSTRRQKIVSVLWHSLVLLLVGGSTGRWPASPGGRRRAAAGVRDPATRHVNTRSTRFFFPWQLFLWHPDRLASLKRKY